MRNSVDRPRLRRALARLVVAVVALNLMVLGIIGFSLHRSLIHQRGQAKLVAENLSRVLEENLSRFIDKIDLTLLAVTDELRRQQMSGGIDRPALEDFLRRHDGRLPEALGLRVVDARGNIEYAVSNVVIGSPASVADREHFLRHRDDPGLGLFISTPVVGRLNPQPMILIARRRVAADGSFAGIVHVAVAVASLQAMFSAVDLGEHGSVGLWNAAPTLVARFARIESGPAPGPSPILRELIAGRSGPTSYHTKSGVDGIERIFYYRPVGSWPLHLVVGVADRDYLLPWWREVRLLGGLAAMFVVVSAVAALVIARGMRALEAARADAEAARRRSDLILASAGEGICGTDATGHVTFINAAARKLLGWAEDEGLGWDFHRVAHHHHPDGSPYAVQDCPTSRVLADLGPPQPRHVTGEVYWRRDGTSFPVEYTVAPIVEGGRVQGAVNLFRDIGERQRIEDERARNLAITTALGNLLRLSLDSQSLDRMLDAALGELLSLPWLRLERQACIFLLQEDGRSLRMAAQRNLPGTICATCAAVPLGHCLCGRAAAWGRVVFADCLGDEHEIRHEGMPEHGHYCVPISGGAGLLGVLNAYVGHHHRRDPAEERFLTMVADTLAGMITRKRIEETLQLSEERTKALLNAPSDAAFLMDADGVILACNEGFAARFGVSPGELAGRQFFDMLPPGLAAQRRVHFDRVVATGQPGELRDERDGRSLDNRLFPVLDANGAVAQVAVFSRDITELQRANEAMDKALRELARSNEELKQFAYVASHDLRQPLRMVTSYLTLVEKRLGGALDGEVREYMDFAIDGARRMDRLIVDLLEYSRTGKGAEPFRPVPLGRAVDEALRNLGVGILEAGAEVVVADGLPTVDGDALELTRLFQNLIGNAVKYRAPDRRPRVEVGWRPQGAEAVVWVRDNGIGIAPEDRERAFGVFQRLVRNDAYEGTGIGLAICRKIVEHHGGRIWIESVPGQGTTFLVAFPATV